jgi:hypothetical protein
MGIIFSIIGLGTLILSLVIEIWMFGREILFF